MSISCLDCLAACVLAVWPKVDYWRVRAKPLVYRMDTDSLGEVRIPADAYYGPFTKRATKQYNATGQPSHPHLIEAFVMIKRSAAIANMRAGVLDKTRGDAIVRACDAILDGGLRDQFVVDMINSGAGTAFNMNANEVIANAALEVLGHEKGEYSRVHPNDDVNMSQSSNDTYPTAMHMAILLNLGEAVPAVDALVRSLKKKAKEFSAHKKIGRTHLMDALPVSLGGEFAAMAESVKRARDALVSASDGLKPVALGGTAVGTGANAPKNYRKTAIVELARVSKLELVPEKDMQFGLQSRFAVANVSGALRNLALEITRLSNDIRLMASGPVAGLAEIGIPAVHAGSSIMPGKVNPSLAESMNMVCFGIVGNDAAVAYAAQAGQFELNVMLPGMLRAVLDSTDMLKRFLPSFTRNLIDGITSDRTGLAENIEKSPVIVTYLNPVVGYQEASRIFKESLSTGKTVRQLVLERGIMTEGEFAALLE